MQLLNRLAESLGDLLALNVHLIVNLSLMTTITSPTILTPSDSIELVSSSAKRSLGELRREAS